MATAPTTEQVLPVKLSFLKWLVEEIPNAAEPPVTVKFIAFVASPPAVEPKLIELAVALFRVNPPVPVQVKFVAVAIPRQVAPVLLVKSIFPVPNAIDLAEVPLELNILVLKVKLFKVIAPVNKVTAPVVELLSVALPESDKFISDLLISMLPQTAVEATVTVAAVPELASKFAKSAVVGADAPAAPPEVKDQLVVELASQVPEPPTQ